MAKGTKARKEFMVQFVPNADLQLGLIVEADNLEEAMAIAKNMPTSEILDFNLEVHDGGFDISGIYRN